MYKWEGEKNGKGRGGKCDQSSLNACVKTE
jgi:hypothetical protein